jgi:hypothetical protein
MGYSLNHIAGFGSPFQVVHEQIVDVLPGATHTGHQPGSKVSLCAVR